jgi:replication initiation protein RepC
MSIETAASQPTGSRRLTLTMLAARDQADGFKGVPHGSANIFRYLAAFQEAEPYLGLPPQAYKLVAWLMKQTMAHDWEEGSRPICWPSAARQGEFLGLSPARVKILNRALFEAGILIIRDSETGKRYGRRDSSGRIVEAYGFDLTPLAYRFEEFIRIAAEARCERERMRSFKKRATCARRAIGQAGETLAAANAMPPEWHQLVAETADLVASIRQTRRTDDMELIAQGLERRREQAEMWLRALIKPIEMNPVGLVCEPHTISTNSSLNPKDTVIAAEEGRGDFGVQASSQASRTRTSAAAGEGQDFESSASLKLNPGELLELTPRLAEHIHQSYPGWPEIVDAAGGFLRAELGISQPLWGEACRVLGRPLAAVTMAIVSTKPKDHFTRGAGGYFAAMVKRAEKGELHIDRTLWKLRRDKWGVNGSSGGKRAANAWQSGAK